MKITFAPFSYLAIVHLSLHYLQVMVIRHHCFLISAFIFLLQEKEWIKPFITTPVLIPALQAISHFLISAFIFADKKILLGSQDVENLEDIIGTASFVDHSYFIRSSWHFTLKPINSLKDNKAELKIILMQKLAFMGECVKMK